MKSKLPEINKKHFAGKLAAIKSKLESLEDSVEDQKLNAKKYAELVLKCFKE